jgi:hypothetical protein
MMHYKVQAALLTALLSVTASPLISKADTPTGHPIAKTGILLAHAATDDDDSTDSTITGRVQQDAQSDSRSDNTALSADDYLDVQYTPLEHQHNMQEFGIVINNLQSRPIELVKVKVLNGLSEEEYVGAQQQSETSRHAASGVLRGLSNIVSNFVPASNNATAAQILDIGTNALNSAADKLDNADSSDDEQEATDDSEQIVQQLDHITINPKQSFQCVAVTPGNEHPMLRIAFKDLQTNQIYKIER